MLRFDDSCFFLIKTEQNVIYIFEALFSPVRIKNSYSMRINSNCSEVARTNQASVVELFCENI